MNVQCDVVLINGICYNVIKMYCISFCPVVKVRIRKVLPRKLVGKKAQVLPLSLFLVVIIIILLHNMQHNNNHPHYHH